MTLGALFVVVSEQGPPRCHSTVGGLLRRS